MAFNPLSIFAALTTVMMKNSVTTVSLPDASKAAKEVIAAVKNEPGIAIVPVKSPWTSKINWSQAAGLLATVVAIFGLPLTSDQIIAAVAGIQAIVAVGTVIFKTFFTNSVTAASAGKTT